MNAQVALVAFLAQQRRQARHQISGQPLIAPVHHHPRWLVDYEQTIAAREDALGTERSHQRAQRAQAALAPLALLLLLAAVLLDRAAHDHESTARARDAAADQNEILIRD